MPIPTLTNNSVARIGVRRFVATMSAATSAALTAALTASLLSAAGSALASNSDATGGNATDDAQAYNVGKGVYAQKLNCKSCPLSGKSLDVSMARELIAGKGAPDLTEQEKQALNVYLSRRFKL